MSGNWKLGAIRQSGSNSEENREQPDTPIQTSLEDFIDD
jgi:hypothetical protein